jgi:hypothetical protein
MRFFRHYPGPCNSSRWGVVHTEWTEDAPTDWATDIKALQAWTAPEWPMIYNRVFRKTQRYQHD